MAVPHAQQLQGPPHQPRPVPAQASASRPRAATRSWASGPSTSSPGHHRFASVGHTNSSIRRKLTALRSLFCYFQVYGYTGANWAQGKFVAAPAVPQERQDRRHLAPLVQPAARRPGAHKPPRELDPHLGREPGNARGAGLFEPPCRRVGAAPRSQLQDPHEHLFLNVIGMAGRTRTTPLRLEAAKRLAGSLQQAGIIASPAGPHFPAARSPRRWPGPATGSRRRRPGRSNNCYASMSFLSGSIPRSPSIHRATGLTTAREQESDIIDLQHFAGHADPRAPLTDPLAQPAQREPRLSAGILTLSAVMSHENPVVLYPNILDLKTLRHFD